MELTHNDLQQLAAMVAQEIKDILGAPIGRWITFAQAMKYARVRSKTTMRKLINEGHVYGFKRGHGWIVDRESIDDYFNTDRMN